MAKGNGNSTFFSYDSVDPLNPSEQPELVFGLVAPAGTEKDKVSKELVSELLEYGYESHIIRVSDLIKRHPFWGEEKEKDEKRRIVNLMDAGNEIRKKSELADAMALLAVSKIVEIRKENGNGDYHGFAKKPNAYIIDSLKNPAEISTLRSIYGSGFILISIYSDRGERVNYLSEKIAKSQCKPGDVHKLRKDAEKIIHRDDQEEGDKYGQNVQGCFPRADLFLSLNQSHRRMVNKLDRFLQIVFNNPFITPTKDEWGMFHAEANSWRSADLSRQVGAAICSEDGEILALGCNEVPRAYGGMYWEGDENDARDFQKGRDKGAEHKRMIVAEILRRIGKDKGFDKKQKSKMNKLINKAINGDDDPVLDGLKALNVIEYGRTVHAEMAALSDAAKRGIRVDGSVMYVNTFPCHICARHIIASGVKRVVYVEPYPKSLTEDLFGDSVLVGKNKSQDGKILFEPFTGVSPRIYRFAFELTRKRKVGKGDVARWSKKKANTKLKRYVTSYLAMEIGVVGKLLPKILEAEK